MGINSVEQINNTHIDSQINQNSGHESSVNSTNHGADSLTAHSEAKQEGGNLITEILSEHLLDHHSYNFYDVFHFDLPVILYDDGLYAYSSMNSMKEAGTFTEIHHKIVRTDNEQAPKFDMSITTLVMFQWIAMFIIFFSFLFVRKRYKKEPFKAPRGFQNFLEMGIEMVRDRIVRVNIHDKKLADSLTPYFVSLWIFIFVLNFLGLIPGGHSATGNLAVTAGLAITAYFVINGSAILTKGIGHWFKEFTGGSPWGLWIIMIPIEILSMFTKPFALTIRLFANMTAGHVVILSLVGLIFLFKSFAIAPVSIGFSLFINLLETLVAMIQAYVFTMLTSVFVGLALGHGDEHSSAH
jgi:F-type H+-transporting ATPase subunit a